MGKLTNFSIHFHSPQPVYYPGQVISGYLALHLQEPMKMKHIIVKFCGKGQTAWTESHEEGTDDDRHTVTDYYKGKENIIKLAQVVFNGPTHPPGSYTYPFTFNLNQGMPSSFEGHWGYIRYIVIAKINKPWKFDHRVKVPISINDLIDTNNPIYAFGVGGEKHKEVGCLCCKAGPLVVSASIDRTCYCPGEPILINANIANNTTRDMQNMHAKLIQTLTFEAWCGGTQGKKTSTKEIGRLGGPPIPKGESATWQNQPFGIPATAPTITNSKLITLHYKLKVVVGVPMGMDPEVKMHILMGTIPYLQTYGQAYQYGTPEDQQAPPAASLIGGAAYAPTQTNLFGYPDMTPPSYSSAVGEASVNIAGDKDQHTRGDMQFTPVYTFAQPYQGEYAPPPEPFMVQPILTGPPL